MNFSERDMTKSNDYYIWMEQVSKRENHHTGEEKTSWLDSLFALFR